MGTLKCDPRFYGQHALLLYSVILLMYVVSSTKSPVLLYRSVQGMEPATGKRTNTAVPPPEQVSDRNAAVWMEAKRRVDGQRNAASPAGSALSSGIPGAVVDKGAVQKLHVVVEGWRGLSHSYAMVCQSFTLELLKRPHLTLSFVDAALVDDQWTNRSLSRTTSVFGNDGGDDSGKYGLFSRHEEEALFAIPPPTHPSRRALTVDLILRFYFPYNTTQPLPPTATRNRPLVLTFGTSESGFAKHVLSQPTGWGGGRSTTAR